MTASLGHAQLRAKVWLDHRPALLSYRDKARTEVQLSALMADKMFNERTTHLTWREAAVSEEPA